MHSLGTRHQALESGAQAFGIRSELKKQIEKPLERLAPQLWRGLYLSAVWRLPPALPKIRGQEHVQYDP